ncbi:MAG: hypothetical protein ABSH22_11340 [Tepidisphaeraceae bacterium]|jgi:hypothetical protein
MLAIGLKLQRRSLPALGAWVLLSVWSSLIFAQSATNPHWTKDGCSSCHTSGIGPIAATAVTALCLTCHDGVHASDEAHPVGRAMTPALFDPGWPTVNGTVQCLTCHDVKQQCDPTADRPQDNAAFLRQAAVPTNIPAGAIFEQPPFCANCHLQTTIQKFNPHMMLEADKHTPISQRCDACHDKPMNASATVRTGNASMRADQLVLCRSCHPRHKDISTNSHVQAAIPGDMLAYMRAREMTGLLNPPGEDLLKQLQSEGAKPTMMVPDDSGRIVCTTCHNPHEQGTFPADSILADRSLRLMKGHLITPVRGTLFCHHCHNL